MLVMVRTSSIFGPYIIFKDGLAVDPVKIEAVVKWESPKSIAKSFLDLVGYYRRFVHGFFFSILAPLTRLTKRMYLLYGQRSVKLVLKSLRRH